MASLKPIKTYGKLGPNPPKVIMILEALGLPYEIEAVAITDIKKPEYLAVNPNGRLPAIYDPNTDLTLWESGAIVEYLVETYDKDNKISFPKGSNDSYLTKQWLYFQTTGQGPYFGQAVVSLEWTPKGKKRRPFADNNDFHSGSQSTTRRRCLARSTATSGRSSASHPSWKAI